MNDTVFCARESSEIIVVMCASMSLMSVLTLCVRLHISVSIFIEDCLEYLMLSSAMLLHRSSLLFKMFISVVNFYFYVRWWGFI